MCGGIDRSVHGWGEEGRYPSVNDPSFVILAGVRALFTPRLSHCIPRPMSTAATQDGGAAPLPRALKFAAKLASGPAYKGVPPPTDDVAKLNANEMNYGPHPAVLKAGNDAVGRFHVYPDPAQTALRHAIASTHPEFSVDEIVAGTGSDDCLDVIIRVIKPKCAIIPTPTFGMYAALCRLHDLKMVEVPCADTTFHIDVDQIEKQADESSMIFLANPNNPTGTSTPLADVARLAKTGALIVLDEAYIEFVEALTGVPSPSLQLVKQYPNVVVMRTLSKWAGLAGLRIGYTLAHPTIIEAMLIAKQPYNINCVAEAAAIKAMEMKKELTAKGSNVFMVAQGAKDLAEKLKQDYCWMTPTPTNANFVLCRIHGFQAESVAKFLSANKVMVRFFGKQGGALEQYIRISVGRPVDMEQLFAVLDLVPTASDILTLVTDLKAGPRTPKALLFDMDGVLADVSGSYRAAIKQAAAYFGATVTDSDIEECKARGDANNDWVVTHRLIAEKGGSAAYEDVVDKFQELYLGGLRDTESLLPDKDLLRGLTSQFKSAVVTGRPREDAEYFLDLFGLTDCFQCLVCMEDTPKPKPDPAPVLKALTLLDINADDACQVLMFGDTVDDIRAGVDAGCIGVGVRLPNGSDAGARLLAAAGADAVLAHGLEACRSLLPVVSISSPQTVPSCVLARHTPSQILRGETTLYRVSTSPVISQIVLDIVSDVEKNKEVALLKYAVRFGDLPSSDTTYMIGKAEMKAAYDRISPDYQSLLTRSAERVRVFAQKQKDALGSFEMPILGGKAGHTVRAVKVAGCYAPGGRYPLPSSVLMTVLPARVAGCETVVVASPRPTDETLAAAHVAGADMCLKIGGAQAIAAMAYGVGGVPECDIIVGPGNAFVTAAKKLVFGKVGIDMLAGPSEVLVLADETANPKIVAADLIAQSEHDTAACSVLVSTSTKLVEDVEKELTEQLAVLPTADVAREALRRNGIAVVVDDLLQGINCCNRLAPEHLEVHTENPTAVASQLDSYGAVFIGEDCAEVTGDYASGPNHTLPTSGTARFSGGLSVLTFLCVRTFMIFDDGAASRPLLEDAVKFALIEGLHGHANAASVRLRKKEGAP